MSYHTARLQKILTKAEVEILLNLISVKIPSTDEEVLDFLDDSIFFNENSHIPRLKSYKLKSPNRKALHAINKGLLSVIFRKWINMTTHAIGYGIQVHIDLQWMLTNEYSNTLFTPSTENNESLLNAFALAIYKLFPDIHNYRPLVSMRFDEKLLPHLPVSTNELIEVTDDDEDVFLVSSSEDIDAEHGSNIGCLPYLPLWKVKRIDASCNIRVKDKHLFLKLCRASFLDGKVVLEPQKYDNNNIIAKSKGRKKTITMTIYDKEEEILKYINQPGQKWRRCLLTPDISDVVRYEIAVQPYRKWIFAHCNTEEKKVAAFEDIYGILPFLDNDFSIILLDNYFIDHIGQADWYNMQQLQHLLSSCIETGTISTQLRNTLCNGIIPLVAQAGGINNAWPMFHAGCQLPTCNNYVFGAKSKKTFKNYIISRNETHAQPVALDGLSDKKSFVNPYHPDNLTLYGTSVDAYNSVLFNASTDLLPLSARLYFTANLAAIISEHRRQMTFDFEKWLANYEKLLQFDDPDTRVKVARTSPYTITLSINGTTIKEWKVSEFVQKWVDTKKFR